MKFDLLGSKSYGRIQMNVFEDLGFIEFLKLIYDDKEMNFLLDLWKLIPSKESIKNRQEILFDVLKDEQGVFQRISIYLEQLQKYYSLYVEETLEVKYIYFLNLMSAYVDFIRNVKESLAQLNLTSKLLKEIQEVLTNYAEDTKFNQMKKDLTAVKGLIEPVYYASLNKDIDQLVISKVKGSSYSQSILELCSKLEIPFINKSLDLKNQKLNPAYFTSLAKLYKGEFKILRRFYEDHQSIFDSKILDLQTQLNFYLLLKRLYHFLDEQKVIYCCPKINDLYSTEIRDCVDLSLVTKVEPIITNDYQFDEEKHIQLISGVNSGGKTSYVKGIGISYLLFLVGGFVPGREANLYPFQNFYTHFPTNEDYAVGSGRLSDEEIRIDAIRSNFNQNCLLIMNETFSSTYEDKALNKSYHLIDELIKQKVTCLYVTHQHKLIEQIKAPQVVKMSPVVDLNLGNKRLYKIQPTDSGVKSYTYDILFQYGLTKEQLGGGVEDEA